MSLCFGQKVTVSRWAKAPDVAHFVPFLILNQSLPLPAIITSLKWVSCAFLSHYTLLYFLYFPLFMNLTEFLHFKHLLMRLSASSSLGCTLCVSVFWLWQLMPVHSYMKLVLQASDRLLAHTLAQKHMPTCTTRGSDRLGKRREADPCGPTICCLHFTTWQGDTSKTSTYKPSHPVIAAVYCCSEVALVYLIILLHQTYI